MFTFFESSHKSALDNFENQVKLGNMTKAMADIEQYIDELPYLSQAKAAIDEAYARHWVFLAAELGDYALVSWLEKNKLGSMQQRNELGQSPYDVAEIYGYDDFVMHQARRDPSETIEYTFDPASIQEPLGDELMDAPESSEGEDPFAELWAEASDHEEVVFTEFDLQAMSVRLHDQDVELENAITQSEKHVEAIESTGTVIDQPFTSDFIVCDARGPVVDQPYTNDFVACDASHLHADHEDDSSDASTEDDVCSLEAVSLDDNGCPATPDTSAQTAHAVVVEQPLTSTALLSSAAKSVASGLELAANLIESRMPNNAVTLESMAQDANQLAETLRV